jgi:IS4 transposase
MTVRRITLTRPGDEPLEMVADLLEIDRYPANDLLELYRKRWGIESVFQKIDDVFHLTHLIGSSPKAVIFQAVFGMVVCNLLQVVQAIIAVTPRRPPSTFSTHDLFKDLHGQLNALYPVADAAPLAFCLKRLFRHTSF